MTKILRKAFCIIEQSEKYAAIDEVIGNCTVFSDLPSIPSFTDAVHKREMEMSTGVGHGVAIAHGKIPGLMSTHVALGLSEQGIDYDDGNAEPVHFLFVLASSPECQADYLQTVSSILSWMHDPEFRELFMNDRSSDAVRTFLSMLSAQDFSPQPKALL